MSYATTKIKAVKSYPTYQLHAESAAEKVSAEDVFKICILETYKWIRSRLESFDSIPNQLEMPLPEEYEQLKMDDLYSFSIDTGFTVDVVYVRSKKIWSFSITEPDMGANPGTADERPPVFGRSFCTDISFRLKEKSVEIGIRTICSEPVETVANCEVFRPALVKSLANNPLVGLKEFFAVNGQAVEVSTKGVAERLLMYIENYGDSLPVILVFSAGTSTGCASDEKRSVYSSVINFQRVLSDIPENVLFDELTLKSRFDPDVRKMELKVDLSNIIPDIKKPFEKENNDNLVIKLPVEKSAEKEITVELENVDYTEIARYSMGYAHVCFISGQCVDYVSKKLGSCLHEGDIAVVYDGEIIKKYSYNSFCGDMAEFQKKLRKEVKVLPKGRTINYGKIRFHTDARLLEIEEKHSEALSYEGKFSLLTVENEELKRKIKELEQLNAGKNVDFDEFRRISKKVRSLEDENVKLLTMQRSMAEKIDIVSAAYRTSTDIIDFYRYKASIAACFPDHKDDVCDWIEEELSDCIVVSPNVRSEMKKYSGEMDVAILCDGLLYLHGYAKYRKGEIDSNALELYAESGKWQAEGCGAEALKVYREDYSAYVNGKKYLMDMHIKYGVNPRMLIRVYFCWDEETRRIIIGHMPSHLATAKQGT